MNSPYSSIDLSPHNPLRPADWRWLRAVGIAKGDLPDDKRLGDRTVRKIRFLAEATQRALKQDEELGIVLKRPELYWAYRIYSDLSPASKAELEARILADDDIDRIAERAAVSPEVIKAYEEVFFDARRFLTNRGYIVNVIIGDALHKGLNEKSYAMLWKYYGFVYGPHMLDSLIERAISPVRPTSAMQVGGAWRDAGFNSILQKQALAAQLMPINTVTQVDVLTVYSKFVEIARTTGEGTTGTATNYDENLSAIMRCLNLSVGPHDQPQVDLPLLRQYDSGSAELTTSQLLQGAQGIVPTGVVEGLTYPEPITDATFEHGSSPAAG